MSRAQQQRAMMVTKQIRRLMGAVLFSILILFACLLIVPAQRTFAAPPTDCSGVTEIPPTECQALIDLYRSTNGASWFLNYGWNTSTPCSGTGWLGVVCTGGNVTQLVLVGNNLNGTLPASLSNLTHLTALALQANAISGTLPALPATLQSINLATNTLSGTLPMLPAGLTLLSISGNTLSGTIPPLPATLIDIDVSGNALSGTIPALPANLQLFNANNNQLSGTIPALPATLTILGVANNQLTGNVPPLNGALVTLDVANNQLSGTLPSLSDPLVVLYAYLDNNQFTGGLSALNVNSRVFSVANNQISGPLIALQGYLNLTKIDASSNQLSGNIPPLPKTLSTLNLFNNQLSGTLPDLPANLTFLRVNSNQLSGTIPASLTQTKIGTYGASQSLYLCGGQNMLTPASADVSSYIAPRLPRWTGSCTPTPPQTIGIFRNSTFYLRANNTTGAADITVAFNNGSKSYPIVGDWTGSGNTTIGVYDQTNGLFALCTVNSTVGCNSAANVIKLVLGFPGDQPLAGRWQATSQKMGVGVFRPSNGLIYLKNDLTTGYADYTIVLGVPGDVGLAGDWNGDGIDSVGVYRPPTTIFYLSNAVRSGSLFGDYQFQLGVPGDAPFTGDWIGQGFSGTGVFRPTNGQIYLKNASKTGFADTALVYGLPNDVPIAGHWAVSSTGSSSVVNVIVADPNLPLATMTPIPPPAATQNAPSSYDG